MEIKRSIGVSIIIFFCASCLTLAQESNLIQMDYKDFPLNSSCTQDLRHTDNRGASMPPDPMIINNEDEYKTLLKLKCLNTYFPDIDFSQKAILIQYAESIDRSAKFIKEVFKDDIKKQIIYSVTVAEHNPPDVSCAMSCLYIEALNAIIIPKLPSGYKVIFKYKNDMPYTKEIIFPNKDMK